VGKKTSKMNRSMKKYLLNNRSLREQASTGQISFNQHDLQQQE
jgi:hypothetical protein